jgi:anthranilate phosphoribosyltransferase
MSEDHPFAQYVRALGKGPNMWRDLDFDEAKAAMSMILGEEAEPLQVGAFLLLLRRKGETGEEFAGMASAAKDLFEMPPSSIAVDYDWPSYADRHRQQPWFTLAALLLADQGYKILMHGIDGYSDGYAPTRPVLELLGVPQAQNLSEAAEMLRDQNLVYVGLEKFCPQLQELFELRPYLGVRTAVNTFARDLNPLNATCQMQGVFHPPYKEGHIQTAKILGVPNAMVFKGGGGEVMRNPMKPARVDAILDGNVSEIVWPALTAETNYKWREENLEPSQVIQLWQGSLNLPVPIQGVIGTLAVALKMKHPDLSAQSLDEMAQQIWDDRDNQRFN